MSDTESTGKVDFRQTLFLPKTEFPMRAGLPKKEPEILERWNDIGLYAALRADGRGREPFVLHDGPPYANGHIHIGTALNKILKDVIVRSQQMMGRDANYVPGWDCHGLPIEWKIEEQYRKKGQDKDEVPINEFRGQCRDFAAEWIDVQREEFKRLGVVGEWDKPYTTMNYKAESQIAREFMKFVMNGSLYQGSKPVMWSVVEKTALAEAEVEYEDKKSPTIYVKFPVIDGDGANLVIWTTTPWTIPGNRALAYSSKIKYGLYEVTNAPEDNWAIKGEKFILADNLASEVMAAARVDDFTRVEDVDPKGLRCEHPFHGQGYDEVREVYEADFVTDDTGTGFVHIAPGHGPDDYFLWLDHGNKDVPHTVGEDGVYFDHVPMFAGKVVVDQKGRFGNANPSVIEELVNVGALMARGQLEHSYPPSWRSKAPVIFRNTPQWFISMEDEKGEEGLRAKALKAIDGVRWVPESGRNRIFSMVEQRPDWVISRQRAWGVPLCCFIHKETGELLRSEALNDKIANSFEENGADAWFADGAHERFLDGIVDDPAQYQKIDDILDVWFDSGSTHAFVLEEDENWDLSSPADLYLEGSDQHRGWFHSSLLESCGTRGVAPYKAVLTHGFVMGEDGRKMSKSLGNVIDPQKVIAQSGSDILRLWVMSSDYTDDLRIGQEILKSNTDAYRKLRNTLRFMLGNLHGFSEEERVENIADMPELERLMLHQLVELDEVVRQGYNDFDFKRIFQKLFNFATVDLSAFYFDIRKDSLYCDAPDDLTRRSCRTVLDHAFRALTAWFAPMLCFTMEETWRTRFPEDEGSVHLRQFPDIPGEWKDDTLNTKWNTIRQIRKVVTGALELERREKNIGSSLEAAPQVYLEEAGLLEALQGQDLAEISITSQIEVIEGKGPEGAFRLEDVGSVSVIPLLAKGQKCQRSWKVLEEVGSDPDFPELSLRDADAVRKFAERTGDLPKIIDKE